jgi:hypothetical protein
VTVNARSETTPDAAKDTAELQQAVESLVRDRPDLIDPRNLRRFPCQMPDNITPTVGTRTIPRLLSMA